MARSRYIKTHSNYVIKDIHQTTNIGTIYERDFMTISEMNSYAPGSLPAYGLNGFKMVINDGLNLKKKHHYGSWLKNKACGKTSSYWTLDCQDGDVEDLLKNGLTLKPSKTSLLDYACYGSAEKLVESSVRYIIDNFPAEVFLTDKKVLSITENNETVDYYYVDNPFEIEFSQVINKDEIGNELRNFPSSYDCYYITGENISDDLEWNQEYVFLSEDEEGRYINDFECREDGKLMIFNLGCPDDEHKKKLELYYFIIDGKRVLLHNGNYKNHGIRPKTSYINVFFNNLKGLTSVLLNKKTNYTAILDTPKETDKGNVVYKKAYRWPKSQYGTWNIDVNSNVFYEYFSDLLDIGEFFDKFYTDNMWRAMTHEAIVNFDWTLTTVDGDGIYTDYDNPESERVKTFIHVAGRAFDDIKLYVDGIANSNAVTYNEDNNNPDYFLPELLTNYGWDVKNVIPYRYNKYLSKPLYPSHVNGYTTQDAVYEFYRRLLLNSNAILSAKGTKRSIEMILALFGYHSVHFLKNTWHEENGEIKNFDFLSEDKKKEVMRSSYSMDEFVHVADLTKIIVNDNEVVNDSDVVNDVINQNKEKLLYDIDNPDELQGLPIEEMIYSKGSYLIPWYDKNKEYDGDVYFESKGGWGQTETKIVDFENNMEIVIDSTDTFKVYDETVKYLKFVDTIEDLMHIQSENPKNGDVYYVYDISKQHLYNRHASELGYKLSHYFILKDRLNDNILGAIAGDDETKYGWKNIFENELSNGLTDDAKKVFYLEGIIENNLGNNPHCGYGNYDDGATYKSYYTNFFTGAIENDSFIDVDDSSITEYGFDINGYTDNIKTWYFSDITVGEEMQLICENYESEDSKRKSRSTEIIPVNPEGGDKFDEAAANSVINTKVFEITFAPDLVSPESMYDFIAEGAMHYAKQVIPSTTILKYKVPMRELSTYCYNTTCIQAARIIR